MKHTLPLSILILFFSFGLSSQELCDCPSQSKIGKGTLYLSWGYNKDWFSKSDIHFINQTSDIEPLNGTMKSYDFTVYQAKAKDRPVFKDIFRTDLSIPQYVYRLGYYFNNKNDFGLEINFDHLKYIMIDNQTLHVKGTIHGKTIDQDTLLNPNTFLHFEHSDGANFLMLNFIKRQRLLVSKNKKHWLNGIVKMGAGPVIPRTEVILFGEHLNNKFHIAGYCMGIETGLRYDAFKHFFLEYSAKGAFANYTDVLVIGTGKANHHFWSFENILTFGLQFPI